MWPFGKRKKKPEKDVETPENDEYILDQNKLWEEVTGEHEIERDDSGNGKIKFKGDRAKKLREADRVQDMLCEDIDRQIDRLQKIRRQKKKTTGSLRALNPVKKGGS